MARKKAHKKPIAFEKGTVSEESLPLPFTHYPGFYGTFFAFTETRDSGLQLCECQRDPIEFYVQRRAQESAIPNADPQRMFLIDSFHFPLSLVTEIEKLGLANTTNCLDALSFRPDICHKCTGSVPSYRWCHEMYGSVFTQNYGWYLNQRRFEVGILDHYVDWARCPDEILQLIAIDPAKYFEIEKKLNEESPEKVRPFIKDYARQKRQVNRVIENQVREQFGFKPVGSPSTGEEILAQIIGKLYPGERVYRCTRPEFLEGLELDIFLPDLNLALEFQGEQHYKAVEHWGGEEGLEALKLRDRKKRRLCAANGIGLVEIRFDESLDEGSVERAIKQQRIEQGDAGKPNPAAS